MSRLDWLWRRLIVTKLYTKGWGNPDEMKRIMLLRKRLGNRDKIKGILPKDYPVYIDKETVESGCRILDGHFKSPVNDHCPGIMPKAVEIARFQMLLPTEWKTNLRPICIHMGGTGDHGFLRRRKMFCQPLLQEEGIASVILENPFYGCRKPKEQFRSSLHHVNDLFIMGLGLILEGNILFNWLDRQGYGPLGATGVSMGGHMASLAVTAWHKPVSLIPCMSGSTGAGTFTHGVLSTAIPWKVLQQQYEEIEEYREDIMELIQSPEPYWSSVYREGREYFHELEHDCDSANTTTSQQVHGDNQSPSPYMNMENQILLNNTSNVDSSTRTCDPILANKVLSQPENNVRETNASASGQEQLNHSSVCESSTSQDTAYSNLYNWVGNIASNVPYLFPLSQNLSADEQDRVKQLDLDVKYFMKGIMDECTHLANFSVPVDPELIIMVIAEHDEYIPHSGYLKLVDIWPGSQLRTIPCGHVEGFINYRKEFLKAVADSFEIQRQKYYKEVR